jgi:hypothetical protein
MKQIIKEKTVESILEKIAQAYMDEMNDEQINTTEITFFNNKKVERNVYVFIDSENISGWNSREIDIKYLINDDIDECSDIDKYTDEDGDIDFEKINETFETIFENALKNKMESNGYIAEWDYDNPFALYFLKKHTDI